MFLENLYVDLSHELSCSKKWTWPVSPQMQNKLTSLIWLRLSEALAKRSMFEKSVSNLVMGKLPKVTVCGAEIVPYHFEDVIFERCDPFWLGSTLEIDPEVVFLACGTILALSCKYSFTVTCYLYLQSGNVDNMNKNSVINQDTTVCSVRREKKKKIIQVLILGL